MTPLERLKEILRPWYLRCVYFPLFPHRRPPHFTACWKHPRRESLPEAVREPGVLFYPMNDWHTRLQRGQHLARAFAAQERRVVYLNPHFGRQFESLPVASPTEQLCELGERIFELHVRLPREPVFHHRLLSARESDIVAAAVERTAGAGDWVQIVSFPTWFEAAMDLRLRRGWPVIYDCHDLLRGFGNVAPEIIAREARAMRESDLVLFSSARLMRDFLAADPALETKSRLLRNAVDAGAFSTIERSAGRVAVYAGALEKWFDEEIMAECAARNPDCRFLLVGRVDAPRIASRLEGRDNVEFTGEVPYGEVPEAMARGKIGLIPFRIEELTLATNPIKLYEYFSLGMPVVSTPLPEVEAFGDLVYIGATPSEFAEAVRRALDEDDCERRDRRRRIAGAESWAARAGALAAEFERLASDTGLPRPAR
jgi:glycosyltransferase involved in cell wall biosynthesis